MARVAYSKPFDTYSTTLHSSRYQNSSWGTAMSTSYHGRKNYDNITSSGYGQAPKARSRSFSQDRALGSTGRVQQMTNNYQNKVFGAQGASYQSSSHGSDSSSYSTHSKPPSGSRRLPPGGPGYQDKYGRKVSTEEAIHDVSSRINKRPGPVRATREDYDPRSYMGNSPRPHSREPDHRSFDRMNLNSDSLSSSSRTSNLTRTKYGSTSNIASTSKDHLVEESVSPLLGHHKSNSTYVKRMNLSNETTTSRSKFPSMEDSRSSSLTRDSSLDGRVGSASRRISQSQVDWEEESTRGGSSHARGGSEGRDKSDTHLQFKPDVNSNQGLTGLANIGNTCFMNSVTQCLSNTRPLLEYFSSNRFKKDLNCDKHGSLTMEFSRVLANLWQSRRTSSYGNNFRASDFKRVVSSRVRKFYGNDQHDAQEFLMYLIQGLHEETNSEKGKKNKKMLDDKWDKCSAIEKGQAAWDWYLSYDKSFFVSTFVGQLKSTLQCTKCNYESNTFDPFWDISLPIRKNRSMQLEECFRIFTEKEKLEGDESPMCERCKTRQPSTKGLTIWRFPRILILELKRFETQFSAYSRPTKLNTRVDFPTTRLDLSAFTDNTSGSVRPVYDLYAVVKHSGTPAGGHYTADAKHPYSGDWHTFNDASVYSQTENRVPDTGAYVLFYELSDSSHAKL